MRIYLKQAVLFGAVFFLGCVFKTTFIDVETPVCSHCVTNSSLSAHLIDPKIKLSRVELNDCGKLSVDEIKILAAELNSDQRIRNIDKFGLKLINNSVVILIQVHTRLDTLKILVESLRHVKFINETLVIFSHDVYSVEIFKLVQSIDFCPVMQLFYPFAIQTHENVFPGSHPNDCPRNLNRTSALEMGCNNAEYPDQFNHYREAHLCQIRHHWLWKIHFAFDRLRILSGFNGTLLRLDDDYYLASDAIHFIRKLNQHRTAYPDVGMYIMGDHEKYFVKSFRNSANVAVKDFYYVGIGRGMAFTRTFWERFRSCSKTFCTYDEYNWDFALHHTVAKCTPGGLKVLKSVANRVFHIGKCVGVHRNHSNCKLEPVQKDIEKVLKYFSANLFPETISVVPRASTMKDTGQQYGGWGDRRDHQLCLNMFNNVTDEDSLLMQIHNNLKYRVKESQT